MSPLLPATRRETGTAADPFFADLADRAQFDAALTAGLTAVLAAAGDVAYTLDVASDTMRWYGAIEDLFGADAPPPATGREFEDRIAAADRAARAAALDAHVGDGDIFDTEYRLLGSDGVLRWIHDRGQASIEPDGPNPASPGSRRGRQRRGVLRAIDGRKQYEFSLLQSAHFDEVTGLFNRTRLQASVAETLTQLQRQGGNACYLTIAVDRLPVVGEGFGRDAADALLLGVARRVERSLRERDLLGRVGIETLGVLLHRCAPDHMAAVARKLMLAVRCEPIDGPDGPIHATLSIGGVALVEIGEAREAMSRAELALNQARARGGDTFIAYEWSRTQRREHRLQMEIGEQVLRALKADEARFAFQPIVDAKTGRTHFYEALLRIPAPDGSILPAGAFLPSIDRLGLNRTVDLHVLGLAVRELSEQPEISLAVNISGLTVSDLAWRQHADGLLRDRPDIARRLIIEITETVAMHDVEEAERFVHAMRALGCRVALDDFGAGYTSFRHLKALSVDIVKIDGSYVQNLPSTPDNQLFVRTLLALCQGFGLLTVAEFVETQAEADLLQEYGVGLLQGYHCGRPQLARPWLLARAARTASRTPEMQPAQNPALASQASEKGT